MPSTTTCDVPSDDEVIELEPHKVRDTNDVDPAGRYVVSCTVDAQCASGICLVKVGLCGFPGCNDGSSCACKFDFVEEGFSDTFAWRRSANGKGRNGRS